MSIFVLTYFALQVNAQQFEKGKIMLAGEIGDFSSNSGSTKLGDSSWVEDFKSYGFTLSPKAGYFFANKFVAGIEIIISRNWYEYSNNITSKNNSSGIGPFFRYYFKDGQITPFGELSAGILNTTNIIKTSNTTFTIKRPGWTAHGALGLAIFMGEKSALELLLGYNTYHYEVKDSNPFEKSKTSGFFFRTGVSFFL